MDLQCSAAESEEAIIAYNDPKWKCLRSMSSIDSWDSSQVAD